jgi:hypothetical protein
MYVQNIPVEVINKFLSPALFRIGHYIPLRLFGNKGAVGKVGAGAVLFCGAE